MTTWALITSLDAPSSGVFDFPSLTLTSYVAIQIIGSGITVTTDGSTVGMTMYITGSEVTSGNYRWGGHFDLSGTGGNTDNANGTETMAPVTSNDVNWTVGNAANEGIGFVLTLYNPGSTALWKMLWSESVLTNVSGAVVGGEGAASLDNTGAVTGVKVKGSSNLTAGKVRILGMA